MLRAWQDVVGKWQLAAIGPDRNPSPASEYFERARSALVQRRLDDALADFQRAAELREHPHPHDQVGIGDVHLARGRWGLAGESYRSALAADRSDPLARLGHSQLLVATGRAADAVQELELMVASRPGDAVLRYYLASTWCSVAEQCRSQTRDEVLVITSEHQLRICDRAARRIIDLDVDDEELARGARRLATEVVAGRRWSWAPEGIAVSMAVLVMSLGLTMVVAGGALNSVGLVVSGVLLGGALLYLIVVRFRRPVWQHRAESLAGHIAKPGV
ncbi:MAG: tetratricopeptide repeat protein [Labedaea sp.]